MKKKTMTKLEIGKFQRTQNQRYELWKKLGYSRWYQYNNNKNIII